MIGEDWYCDMGSIRIVRSWSRLSSIELPLSILFSECTKVWENVLRVSYVARIVVQGYPITVEALKGVICV